MGAVHEALDEVDRLEAQMTVYREDSELSRLNRTASLAPVAVEERLYDLLRFACAIGDETGGAFDITAGPLIGVGGFLSGREDFLATRNCARPKKSADGTKSRSTTTPGPFRSAGREWN